MSKDKDSHEVLSHADGHEHEDGHTHEGEHSPEKDAHAHDDHGTITEAVHVATFTARLIRQLQPVIGDCGRLNGLLLACFLLR